MSEVVQMIVRSVAAGVDALLLPRVMEIEADDNARLADWLDDGSEVVAAVYQGISSFNLDATTTIDFGVTVFFLRSPE